MQPSRTSSLFHFTKSVEILKCILREGLSPRYCLEDNRWINDSHWAFPMVCFCDIPLTRLSEHVDFYGHYGIGLSRDWGVAAGISPLNYINTGSVYAKSIKSTLKGIKTHTKGKKGKSVLELQIMGIQMAAFKKPLKGIMKMRDGSTIEKDFYSECEWRYVPDLNHDDIGFLSEEVFNKKEETEKLNEKAKASHLLKIKPDDIKYLLVKDESEIPQIYDFINTELGENSANSIKRLATRIISLQKLQADM